MGVLSRTGDDARFEESNAASAAQLGLQPSEMTGRSALELGIPAPLVSGWMMALDAAEQMQAPLDVRWHLSTRHGLRTFTSRVLLLPEQRGSTLLFGHVTQDWTGAENVAVGDQAERERLAGALASALAEEIEAPLEQLLGLIGIVSDEVRALADIDPALELEECGRVLASAVLLARRAHGEHGHRSARPVVRDITHNSEARAAIGAVDEGIAVASVLRIQQLAQAIIADSNIRRN